jgi:hypothetical protein
MWVLAVYHKNICLFDIRIPSLLATTFTGSLTSTVSKLQCITNSFASSRTLSITPTTSYPIVVITVTPVSIANLSPLSVDGLDSSSNAYSSGSISNSIVVVISVLSAFAGLSILVGILLCFRAYKRRHLAIPGQGRPIDLEQDSQRSPSILIIGPSPEMLQQQSGLEKELPLPPTPPQTLDPFEDEFTSPSTLSAARDWESVSDKSQREKRGTIASSELQHDQSN